MRMKPSRATWVETRKTSPFWTLATMRRRPGRAPPAPLGPGTFAQRDEPLTRAGAGLDEVAPRRGVTRDAEQGFGRTERHLVHPIALGEGGPGGGARGGGRGGGA